MAEKLVIMLIRHGETQSNKKHRYLGRTDEALSQEGKSKLMKHTFLSEVDYVFSSPMIRCIETASILYPKIEPVLIEEWREIDFGAFEGKTYNELAQDTRYQRWIDSNGTLPFPEGESREEFTKRSIDGFWKMIKQLPTEINAEAIYHNRDICMQCFADLGYEDILSMKKQGVIVVACVVHGGTIMSICSSMFEKDYFDYQIKNGAYQCIIIS